MTQVSYPYFARLGEDFKNFLKHLKAELLMDLPRFKKGYTPKGCDLPSEKTGNVRLHFTQLFLLLFFSKPILLMCCRLREN